ncbi:hypothetical protein SUSUWATARI_00310 [Serratia phage vB_SmaM-Susuwatari]|nr:hypothetical protein SUSUWATARI_00310 [Serratia phage vB_SmaM-Susuwatari]
MFTLKVITEKFDGTRQEDGNFLGPKYSIDYVANDPEGVIAKVTDNRGDTTYSIYANENAFIVNSFGAAVTSITGPETKRGKEKAQEAQS